MHLWPRLSGTWLTSLLLVAAALANPVPTETAAPPPTPTHGGADVLGAAVLEAINDYRRQAGLPRWVVDDALVVIAAGHSQAQAAQGRLSHGGFPSRLAQTRAQRCVENLAAGHRSAQAVVDAWRASPQHRQNLLDPGIDRVGVASADGVVSMLACRYNGR